MKYLATFILVGALALLLHDDPLHRFHRTHHYLPPAVRVLPRLSAKRMLPRLPVKPGTTDATEWRHLLNEAAMLLGDKS